MRQGGSDDDADTWRAVYTVAIANAVYVPHFFKKKSKTVTTRG